MSENKGTKREWLYLAVIALLVGMCWDNSNKSGGTDTAQPTESAKPSPATIAPQPDVFQTSTAANEPIQQYGQTPPPMTEAAEKRLQATTDPDLPAEETNRSVEPERSVAEQSSDSTTNVAETTNQVAASPYVQQPELQPTPTYQTSPAPIARAPRAAFSSGGIYIGTGGGHWISENHDGEIIELEDGSMWRVDAVDTVDSVVWLPVSNITVVESNGGIGYELINTDDHEKVSATLIKQ